MRTSIFLRAENQTEINSELTTSEVYCLPMTTSTSASIQRNLVSEGLRSRQTLFLRNKDTQLL